MLEEENFEPSQTEDVAHIGLSVGESEIGAEILGVAPGAKHDAHPGAVDESQARQVDGGIGWASAAKRVDLSLGGVLNIIGIGGREFIVLKQWWHGVTEVAGIFLNRRG